MTHGISITPELLALNLRPLDLLVLAQVHQMSKRQGYCWATNTQLGQGIDADRNAVGRAIKRLETAGHIEVKNGSNHCREIAPLLPNEGTGADSSCIKMKQQLHQNEAAESDSSCIKMKQQLHQNEAGVHQNEAAAASKRSTTINTVKYTINTDKQESNCLVESETNTQGQGEGKTQEPEGLKTPPPIPPSTPAPAPASSGPSPGQPQPHASVAKKPPGRCPVPDDWIGRTSPAQEWVDYWHEYARQLRLDLAYVNHHARECWRYWSDSDGPNWKRGSKRMRDWKQTVRTRVKSIESRWTRGTANVKLEEVSMLPQDRRPQVVDPQAIERNRAWVQACVMTSIEEMDSGPVDPQIQDMIDNHDMDALAAHMEQMFAGRTRQPQTNE